MNIRSASAAFIALLEERKRDVFIRCVEEIEESVLRGSNVTGSKGCPVKTGNARGSIIGEFVSVDPLRWRITATGFAKDAETGEVVEVGYVPIIEANIRGAKFTTGGPHFFSLTVAGLPKIFEVAATETLQGAMRSALLGSEE